MVRRLIGRFIEWALGYDHVLYYNGKGPSKGYLHDAGLDLYVTQEVTIKPGGHANVPSDTILYGDNLWFFLTGRSSTFHKRGLQVIPAIIDHGYSGAMYVVVYNTTDKPVTVKPGERVAQAIPFRTIYTHSVKAEEIPRSVRGDNGFGSTGR